MKQLWILICCLVSNSDIKVWFFKRFIVSTLIKNSEINPSIDNDYLSAILGMAPSS